MKHFCEGCPWRGQGAVIVPEHGNTGVKYVAEKVPYPICDLPDDAFIVFAWLENFYGKVLNLTGQKSKTVNIHVRYQYGTAPDAKACIGSSYPQ